MVGNNIQVKNELIEYWLAGNVTISKGNKLEQIEVVEKNLNIHLPGDLKEYFGDFNGMQELYPNYTDSNGFLFYPLEKLISREDELGVTTFRNEKLPEKKCIIFAEYMHKSWWYGLILNQDSPEEYDVVIIPNAERFKVITKSFWAFIHYYITDDAILYNHE